MTHKKPHKVLLTGANGTIGTAVRKHLGDRYEFISLDRAPVDGAGIVGDIADLDTMERASQGMDAIVHLAASISVFSPWEDVLRNNIIGTYNVYEAARRAGVGCVVFASSNHAVGQYEVEGAPDIYATDHGQTLDTHVDIRPDSFYGISKAYGEAMGRYYSDTYGMRVYGLRIGTVTQADDPTDPSVVETSGWLGITDEQKFARLRATWLSQRDAAQLIGCCLDAVDVPFGIYYGISDNPRKLWEIDTAREQIGYQPQDGAPA